jgi:hypothetical protein
MSKKSSIIITAIITLFSFFTIAWLSCSKPADRLSCDGIVCENGGYCYQDVAKPHIPHCACPSGYEGPYCATASAAKYIGRWDIKQHIEWSDSVNYIGKDSSYLVDLVNTSTPTTFFINNFFNDVYYNSIICNIDSAHTSNFIIDTLSNFNMFYDRFKIMSGYGTIDNTSTIVAHMNIKFRNKTYNWQQDSITFTLHPHN